MGIENTKTNSISIGYRGLKYMKLNNPYAECSPSACKCKYAKTMLPHSNVARKVNDEGPYQKSELFFFINALLCSSSRLNRPNILRRSRRFGGCCCGKGPGGLSCGICAGDCVAVGRWELGPWMTGTGPEWEANRP